MSKIRERIPDDAILAAKLSVVLNSNLPNFIEATYSERATMRARIWHMLISIGFLCAILTVFYVLDIDFRDTMGQIIGAFALGWGAILVVSGERWFMSKRMLSQEMNMAFVPIIMNVIDAMALYTHSANTPGDTLHAMQELLGRTDIEVTARDRYQVFSDTAIQYDEIHITKQNTAWHKALGANEVAKGVLITACVPEEWNGMVAVPEKPNTLCRNAWNHLAGGKTLAPAKDIPKVQLAAVSDSQLQAAINQGVYEALSFLGTEQPAGFVLRVEAGQLQLFLLDCSIQVQLGTATTERTKIGHLGFRILRPIWKGIRVVEQFNPPKAD